ncbi:hypothetical protein BH09SUM1_BH09SUM1_13730 [soil metagenome]
MKRIIAAAIAIAGFAAAVMATDNSAPPSQTAPLKIAPMKYFEQKCARCHGPQGAFMADGFGKKYDAAGLRKIVKEMAEGPGDSPLTSPQDLDAQTAYNRAIGSKKLFIAWTKIEGAALSGEFFGGKAIIAASGKTSLPVTTEEGVWSLELPAGIDTNSVELNLKSEDGKTSVTLNLAKESYTGAPPKFDARRLWLENTEKKAAAEGRRTPE